MSNVSFPNVLCYKFQKQKMMSYFLVDSLPLSVSLDFEHLRCLLSKHENRNSRTELQLHWIGVRYWQSISYVFSQLGSASSQKKLPYTRYS